jgi:hypothetical protein
LGKFHHKCQPCCDTCCDCGCGCGYDDHGAYYGDHGPAHVGAPGAVIPGAAPGTMPKVDQKPAGEAIPAPKDGEKKPEAPKEGGAGKVGSAPPAGFDLNPAAPAVPAAPAAPATNPTTGASDTKSPF